MEGRQREAARPGRSAEPKEALERIAETGNTSSCPAGSQRFVWTDPWSVVLHLLKS